MYPVQGCDRATNGRDTTFRWKRVREPYREIGSFLSKENDYLTQL